MIKSVTVKKLFGIYNLGGIGFQLSSEDTASIAFLYGENGIGKTTILKLIFSMLSPAPNQGHRTALGNIKFQEFTIVFEDEQVVSLQRPSRKLSGGYTYHFSGPRAQVDFKLAESDLGVADSWPSEKRERIKRLSDTIARISPRIVFVNDHRTVRSTHPPWDIRSAGTTRGGHMVRRLPDGELELVEDDAPDVDLLVSSGLDHLFEATWRHFVDSAFSGNRRANFGTGQTYLEIAKALARSSSASEKLQKAAMREFDKRCDAIEQYIQIYGRYNIIEADAIVEMRDIINNADLDKKGQIIRIVEPYLSSIERSINETQNVARQIMAFEKNINFFLFRKKANININERITISPGPNEYLGVEDLSSGERHLLYLCCASVLSWESPTLMLYDEPELSLNHKWQRKLIDALLEIASPSTQFIMATHSFEIISQHRRSAQRLRIVQ